MNRDRLVFAAGRGAGIQKQHFRDNSRFWEVANYLPIADAESDYDYRIHPDDVHLEYGPISLALRQCVMGERNLATMMSDVGYLADVLVARHVGFSVWGTVDRKYVCPRQEHIETFYLLMAEYMADMGM